MFSDEKFFDIDNVRNSENEGLWIINRAAADETGGVMQKQKFLIEKVMVWLGACPSKLVTSLVNSEKGIVQIIVAA